MKVIRKRRAVLLITLALSIPLLACGPWFPNRLLDGGDEAVLIAPYASFFREIARMQLLSSSHVAKPLTNNQSYAGQTADADLEDLRAALRKAGVVTKDRSAIVKRYEAERAKWHPTTEKQKEQSMDLPAGQASVDKAEAKSGAKVPEGLPGEFTDYFRGAIAWADDDVDSAVADWEALLERPAKERPFKSTWAAFMLGKACLDSKPELARKYFRQVRSLTKEGFTDSLALAAASLGWEAKTYYDQEQFLPATELYLEQSATGDQSAIMSLIWIASKVVKSADSRLEDFARHPKAQRVITAYLLGEHHAGNEPEGRAPSTEAASRWLSAVEATRVKDIAAAEQLALAAYRYGHVDRARRWLKVSKDTPVSQWLQAKLLLRDGKVDQAAALLTRASRSFPLAPSEAQQGKQAPFQESLYVNRGGEGTIRTAPEQLWGELGTIRLARREYTEALDALLRAGFWDDAAYVAERVLTPNELKAFVDQRWSEDPELQKPRDEEELSEPQRACRVRLANMRASLRHLLARRLTRDSRGSEARAYIPEEFLAHFETLMRELDAGYDEANPVEERAQHFMAAARVARLYGIELLGTELEPDYAIYGGGHESGVTPASRRRTRKVVDSSDNEKEVPQILHASEDELRRTAGEPADPPQRFHYRYVAAELGWTAAQLLSDNTDEKARILCEAGSWIKHRNPQAADRFYKELVRKCRKTAIGQWADYIRWFPLLDEYGNLRPKQPGPPHRQPPSPPAVEEPAQEPNDPLADAATEQLTPVGSVNELPLQFDNR